MSPAAIATALVPLLVNLGTVGALGFAGTAMLALGLGYAALIGGGLLVAAAFGAFGQKKPEEVQSNFRQATPWRMALYGQGRLGGPWAFGAADDGDFHKIIALSARPISAINAYWIDDNDVTLTGDPATGATVTSQPYDSAIRVERRLGAVPNSHYSHLTAAFPEWTSAHRGDGIASVYLELGAVKPEEVLNTYPNAVQTLIRCDCDGVAVFDPNDGAQDFDDESSWTYSDNAARVIMDYLRHESGMKVPAAVLGTPLALAGWAVAAEDSDDAIALAAGGTEARYRIWAPYTYDERPADVLGRMLLACNGRLKPTADGGLTMDVGKWHAPEIALDERAVLSFDGVGRGRDIKTTANRVNGQFTSVAHGYQAADADPWLDDDDISLRGEIEVSADVLCSPSHGQTRRLMKIAAHRSNPEWVGQFSFNLRGLAAYGERVIDFDYPPLGISGSFEVMRFEFVFGEHGTLTGCRMALQTLTAAAYAWTAASEEGTAPVADEATDGDEIPDVDDFTATLFRKTVAGVPVPFALLEWTAPSDVSLRIELRGGIVGATAWTSIGADQDETEAESFVLDDGEEYEFEARHTSAAMRPGNWTPAAATVEAIADPTAPGALTGVSVPSSGLGGFTVSATTPVAANSVAVELAIRTSIGTPTDSDIVATQAVAALTATAFNLVAGGGSRTNLIANGTFTGSAASWTVGAGWTYGANAITHAGASTNISQAAVLADNEAIRTQFTISGRTAGSANIRLFGGTAQTQGAVRTTNATFNETLTEPNQASNNNLVLINGGTSFDGTIDNVTAYKEAGLPNCLAAGTYYAYLRCVNASGVGTWSGPHTVAVI